MQKIRKLGIIRKCGPMSREEFLGPWFAEADLQISCCQNAKSGPSPGERFSAGRYSNKRE